MLARSITEIRAALSPDSPVPIPLQAPAQRAQPTVLPNRRCWFLQESSSTKSKCQRTSQWHGPVQRRRANPARNGLPADRIDLFAVDSAFGGHLVGKPLLDFFDAPCNFRARDNPSMQQESDACQSRTLLRVFCRKLSFIAPRRILPAGSFQHRRGPDEHNRVYLEFMVFRHGWRTAGTASARSLPRCVLLVPGRSRAVLPPPLRECRACARLEHGVALAYSPLDVLGIVIAAADDDEVFLIVR